jgi:uncharacterized protein (TIGR02145 family)
MKKLILIGAACIYCLASFAQDGNLLIDPRDNKEYKTIKVGNQVWMSQNLNYEEPGSECYKNKAANCEAYGKLYGSSSAQRVCPEGWHLPSKEEVDVFLSASTGMTDFFTYSGLTSVPLYNFNNSSELNITYGGYETMTGKFENLDKEVYFWTSTKLADYTYTQYYFDKSNFVISASQFMKAYGCYVRCVKN